MNENKENVGVATGAAQAGAGLKAAREPKLAGAGGAGGAEAAAPAKDGAKALGATNRAAAPPAAAAKVEVKDAKEDGTCPDPIPPRVRAR
jgi:hypothetical protein